MGRLRKTLRLIVLQDGREIGHLERALTGAISFQYSSEWLDLKGAVPVSQSLPLKEDPFRGPEVASFFDNLLPDHIEVREKIASRLNAESAKTFDLLYAIGQDCVGALQFVPDGNSIPDETEPRGTVLSEAQIAERLRNLGFFPLGLDPNWTDFRISIAGAQEKTAFLKKRGKWHLPKGSTPTTHIFKPPMGMVLSGIDLRTSVENEWLCLEICRALGLEVAKATMESFEDQKCLVVERFDREWKTSKRLLRLPQEDMCQALGLPSTKKYQSDGGPGIVEIMRFLDASDERSKDKAAFMRAQVAFYILAATDGHAKNFSISPSETGFRMTPIYDVMSVFPAMDKKQLPRQKAKLAMAVGTSKHYRLVEIARRHFEQTAKASGFPKKELDALIEDLHDRVGRLETTLQLPKGFPAWILNSILKGAKKQSENLVLSR